MTTAEKEILKFVASFLNSLANSAFSVGVVGPIVALAVNLGGLQGTASTLPFIFSTLFWGSLGLMLHSIGKAVLSRLED